MCHIARARRKVRFCVDGALDFGRTSRVLSWLQAELLKQWTQKSKKSTLHLLQITRYAIHTSPG